MIKEKKKVQYRIPLDGGKGGQDCTVAGRTKPFRLSVKWTKGEYSPHNVPMRKWAPTHALKFLYLCRGLVIVQWYVEESTGVGPWALFFLMGVRSAVIAELETVVLEHAGCGELFIGVVKCVRFTLS